MTTKTRTITLTDRVPVKIRDDEWPLIAHGSGRSRVCHHTPIPDNEVDACDLRVRQHADGRVLVYGVLNANPTRTGTQSRRCGELLLADADIVAACRRIGEGCGFPRPVIDACIADLPAEEI